MGREVYGVNPQVIDLRYHLRA